MSPAATCTRTDTELYLPLERHRHWNDGGVMAIPGADWSPMRVTETRPSARPYCIVSENANVMSRRFAEGEGILNSGHLRCTRNDDQSNRMLLCASICVESHVEHTSRALNQRARRSHSRSWLLLHLGGSVFSKWSAPKTTL